MNSSEKTKLLFDFSDPAAGHEWSAIDDRVMGGVSSSRLRQDPAGHAIFEGTVSLERNGGFASVRSTPAQRGKPGAQTCFIEARATGKRFKISLLVDDAFDSINYQASLAPEPTWKTLHIPLASFRATFRGRDVPGAPPLDPTRIRQVGLMIAERQAGTFALEVRRIGLATSDPVKRPKYPGDSNNWLEALDLLDVLGIALSLFPRPFPRLHGHAQQAYDARFCPVF